MTFSLFDKVFYIVFRDAYFEKKGMILAPFWYNGIWTKEKKNVQNWLMSGLSLA